jgi:hypothetical protein
MISKDIELDAREMGLELLQTVDDCQHLLVMGRVVLFRRVECSRVKPRGNHRLVIFSLAKIATEASITGVSDKHDRIRVGVIDGLAHGIILRQPFDVAKGFIVLGELFEFHAFAREI